MKEVRAGTRLNLLAQATDETVMVSWATGGWAALGILETWSRTLALSVRLESMLSLEMPKRAQGSAY